jgi:hypothetical protein
MVEPAANEDVSLHVPPQAAPVIDAAPSAGTTAKSSFLKGLGEYKEFITIIAAAIGGLWLAVDYFVTRDRFAEVMVRNQCQLFANIAKLNQQINENYYRYMNDKTFEQTFPYQQKTIQNVALSMDEAKKLKDLQATLDTIKRDTEASAARAKVFDDALNTNNCDKIITFTR